MLPIFTRLLPLLQLALLLVVVVDVDQRGGVDAVRKIKK
jgi:hypothetical protein